MPLAPGAGGLRPVGAMWTGSFLLPEKPKGGGLLSSSC